MDSTSTNSLFNEVFNQPQCNLNDLDVCTHKIKSLEKLFAEQIFPMGNSLENAFNFLSILKKYSNQNDQFICEMTKEIEKEQEFVNDTIRGVNKDLISSFMDQFRSYKKNFFHVEVGREIEVQMEDSVIIKRSLKGWYKNKREQRKFEWSERCKFSREEEIWKKRNEAIVMQIE